MHEELKTLLNNLKLLSRAQESIHDTLALDYTGEGGQWHLQQTLEQLKKSTDTFDKLLQELECAVRLHGDMEEK